MRLQRRHIFVRALVVMTALLLAGAAAAQARPAGLNLRQPLGVGAVRHEPGVPAVAPKIRGTLRVWACSAAMARAAAPAPCTKQVSVRGGSTKLTLPPTLTGEVRIVVVRRGR